MAKRNKLNHTIDFKALKVLYRGPRRSEPLQLNDESPPKLLRKSVNKMYSPKNEKNIFART